METRREGLIIECPDVARHSQTGDAGGGSVQVVEK